MSVDVERMVEKNLARLRAGMAEAGLEALLINRIDHYHYVTGLKTLDIKWYLHRQAALVTRDRLACLPALADEEAARATGRFDLVRGLPLAFEAWPAILAATLGDLGVLEGAIGYDPTLAYGVVEGLGHLFPGELKNAGSVLGRARAVKNPDEVALIREALGAVETALEVGFRALRQGLRETELSARIAGELLRQADGFGFPPIVSSGLNFALPLRFSTEKPIGEQEMVALCASGLKGGYYGELHRMSATGPLSDEQTRMYRAVHGALRAGIEAIRPDVPLQALDDALRGAVRGAGYAPYEQKHVTGHGLGCNVLDFPLIGDPGAPVGGLFEPGMVVHVVAGIFQPEVCGCRASEVVLVTPEGHELLSQLRHPFLP